MLPDRLFVVRQDLQSKLPAVSQTDPAGTGFQLAPVTAGLYNSIDTLVPNAAGDRIAGTSSLTDPQGIDSHADPIAVRLCCRCGNGSTAALHLLGNAMHHIGKDGIFILRAFRCTEGVRVEVEDHGPGIAAADLPYIFDRYYRSRSDAGKQGTGLGLSITKAIFQQHSFRFGVQSTVGKGTTFWFVMSDLPYVDDFEGK